MEEGKLSFFYRYCLINEDFTFQKIAQDRLMNAIISDSRNFIYYSDSFKSLGVSLLLKGIGISSNYNNNYIGKYTKKYNIQFYKKELLLPVLKSTVDNNNQTNSIPIYSNSVDSNIISNNNDIISVWDKEEVEFGIFRIIAFNNSNLRLNVNPGHLVCCESPDGHWDSQWYEKPTDNENYKIIINRHKTKKETKNPFAINIHTKQLKANIIHINWHDSHWKYELCDGGGFKIVNRYNKDYILKYNTKLKQFL